jgi:hypothetical protein
MAKLKCLNMALVSKLEIVKDALQAERYALLVCHISIDRWHFVHGISERSYEE